MSDPGQDPREIIPTMKCPLCRVQFTATFWKAGAEEPTPEQLTDPHAWIVIICLGCAQILAFHCVAHILIKAPGQLLAGMPKEELERLTAEQRNIWASIVRAKAREIAQNN
jgi:hypothetical protein